MLPSKLAFVDLETTGTSQNHDRIIEVGLVRVEDGVVTKTFSSLINPHVYIPPQITTITGIQTKDVESAPSFREIADELTDLLKDTIFVAHNVRFDYGFLKYEFARLNKTFTMKHFCTVRLSRLLFPNERHHNLDAIIERFKIACENRHRAFDDANVLAKFYEIIQKTIQPETLKHMLSLTMKQPSLPPNLSKEQIENLPESPGVYMFHGENDMPLYIGKSINIRDRVLSHFASDVRHGTEMKISQQIYKVSTIQTAGELGALFLESRLIKKHLPLYNRRLRYSYELIALKEAENDDGYKTVTMETLDTTPLDSESFSKVIGVFRNKQEVKRFLTHLAKEYSLCEKLLGLEKTKGACFSSRLEICKGACEKNERPLFYNLRFTTAFSQSKLLPWPFHGPIVIEERDALNKISEAFVFNRWCYLGSIKQREDHEGVSETSNPEFDLDTYKILRSYLRQEKNGVKVRVIKNEDLGTIFNETQMPLLHLT